MGGYNTNNGQDAPSSNIIRFTLPGIGTLTLESEHLSNLPKEKRQKIALALQKALHHIRYFITGRRTIVQPEYPQHLTHDSANSRQWPAAGTRVERHIDTPEP